MSIRINSGFEKKLLFLASVSVTRRSSWHMGDLCWKDIIVHRYGLLTTVIFMLKVNRMSEARLCHEASKSLILLGTNYLLVVYSLY